MQIKIVLCGGPCGGKTTSLNEFKRNLLLKGYTACTIEETATFLFNIGYAPNENISTYDFQNLLLKLQYLKEYIAENQIASKEKGIIVCDRGLLDGIAYLEYDKFISILKENELDIRKILRTYDCAVYFKSLSKINPELFCELRTYETPEIGSLRDDKSYEIWSSLNNIINPLNINCLQEKIYYAIEYIVNNHTELSDSNVKLSKFYDIAHFEFVKYATIELLKNYPPDFKDKQKQLIKKLSEVKVK